MFGLNQKDTRLLILVAVLTMFAPIILNPFPEGSGLAQFNAGYPDLMQRFVIFEFLWPQHSVRPDRLFELWSRRVFGCRFLRAIWMMKLVTMNVIRDYSGGYHGRSVRSGCRLCSLHGRDLLLHSDPAFAIIFSLAYSF